LLFDNNKRQGISNKILGVELSKEQQEDLKVGKTIFVSGLKDKNEAGKYFDSYIKFNKEKNKLDFFKFNRKLGKHIGAN